MKKILLLLLIITGVSVNAQDVIRLKNGNEINGELKSMDRGVLTIETDYSDSDFKVEWDQLKYIKTSSKYIVSLSKETVERLKVKGLIAKNDSLGDRIFATLETHPNNPEIIILRTNGGNKNVSMKQIVYLNSVNDSFLSRLSATIDVGFNLTKANNLHQLNVSSTLAYEADKWGADGGFNVVDSKQDSVARIHRLDANIGFNWYLPKDFYLAVSANYLENDELQLDLRSTYKAGLGFFILRTNHLYWKVEGGAAFTEELYFPDPSIDPNPKASGEGYIGTEINLFDIGDLNLMSNIIVYPSITESGRTRSDFKFEAKYDLPYDLYIKAGTTVNYDNQPAVVGGEYDYVINTGLGWEL
ncbi:MAG: DUF481 domain-containing protein [Flavobacteriales bacterium]|nr:DUF481 domain-containing protein [Flavobacteriales bacterium]